MNRKKLVTVTNTIAIFSVIILFYWVFITIILGVFDLKVLQKQSSDLFFSSIGIILTFMFGSLILNVMLNLTRIAEKHNADKIENEESSHPKRKMKNKIALIGFFVSFPLIVLLLLLGDYLSAVKREKMLFASADLIVEESSNMMSEITNYSFDNKWIDATADSLNLISKLDKNYKRIYVIVQDKIGGKNVYLIFPSSSSKSDKEEPKKLNYIFQTDMEEKLYLGKVFGVSDGDSKKKFKSSDGNYELFYPITVDGKTVVLWLKDRQVYGGSGK